MRQRDSRPPHEVSRETARFTPAVADDKDTGRSIRLLQAGAMIDTMNHDRLCRRTIMGTCWYWPETIPTVVLDGGSDPGGCFTNSDGLSHRTTGHRPMLFVQSRTVQPLSDSPTLLVTPPPPPRPSLGL